MENIRKFLELNIGALTVGRALTALLILAGCLIVSKILLRIFDRALKAREQKLGAFMSSALRVILLALSALIAADYVGVPVSSLIAVLSVAGLAVSLAVQGLLSNVAGGLMILSSKPFSEGDFIEAGGVSGTVKEVGLSYTTLAMADNRVVFVPNSDISAGKIINYTAEESRRIEINVCAAYDSPTQSVKAALLEAVYSQAVRAEGGTLDEPEPFAGINAYRDSSIEYVLRVWCRTGDYNSVRFALLEAVRASFDSAGVEMTYNHLNVHIKTGGRNDIH